MTSAKIIGIVGGTADGVIGCYAAVRNTESPAERRFMIRSSARFGVSVVAQLSVLLLERWVGIPRKVVFGSIRRGGVGVAR
jgi:hypothetical protein